MSGPWWLLCCGAQPARVPSYTEPPSYRYRRMQIEYAKAAVKQRQEEAAAAAAEKAKIEAACAAACAAWKLSRNSAYGYPVVRIPSRSPSDQDNSMMNVLQAALRRRRCNYSSADLAAVLRSSGLSPDEVQSFLAKLTSNKANVFKVSNMSITSAKRFLAFKSTWAEATATCGILHFTVTGLTLHEQYLQQHLKDAQYQTCVCVGLSRTAKTYEPMRKRLLMRKPEPSSSKGTEASSNMSASTSSKISSKVSSKVGRKTSRKSSSKASRVDSQELADWALFAQPPDIYVESKMLWNATLCSNSSDGSINPNLACRSARYIPQAVPWSLA